MAFQLTATTAIVEIEGISAYSQSKETESLPVVKGEAPGDRDIRLWKEHMHVLGTGPDARITIPVHGFHQCLISGAKYSKIKIPGEPRGTWTAKFAAGISFPEEIITNQHTDDAKMETIYANAKGQRGIGTRVLRRFPVFYNWAAKFPVLVLEPRITKDIFEEIVSLSGMFVGIGRFRPENTGHLGRFSVKSLEWRENEAITAAKSKRRELLDA